MVELGLDAIGFDPIAGTSGLNPAQGNTVTILARGG